MKFCFVFFIIFLVFLAFVRYLENTSIFFPSREIQFTPKNMAMSYEDISFKTKDDVTLNGWLIKAGKTAATLIFFHGNAGNMGDRLSKISLFHDIGVNVFIIDYRGYGKSSATPSEKGLYLDALAAYDYLMRRPDIDHNKIIAYGESLGGVAAVDLASQRLCAALIVDSSFTKAADMAKRMYPFVPTIFMSIKMDSSSKVRKITTPKLFIHSQEDEVVPFSLGQKLFEEAASPKEFVEVEGFHNDGYTTSRDVYFREIKEFLSQYNLID